MKVKYRNRLFILTLLLILCYQLDEDPDTVPNVSETTLGVETQSTSITLNKSPQKDHITSHSEENQKHRAQMQEEVEEEEREAEDELGKKPIGFTDKPILSYHNKHISSVLGQASHLVKHSKRLPLYLQLQVLRL